MGVRRLGVVVGVAALASSLALVPIGAQAHPASSAPAIELLTAARTIAVDRFGGSPDLTITDAVYVGAPHQPFEIDAVRHHHSISLEQVRRHGKHVTPIRRITPTGKVTMGLGLPRFFVVTLADSAGRVVRTTRLAWCPAGGLDSQRIDPAGPAEPTYPGECGDKLTRAMVWGIDRGWANGIDVRLKAAPAVVPDGRYTLTITVARSYARQLRLLTASRSVHEAVVIKTETPVLANVRRASTSATAATRGWGKASAGLPDLISLPAHDLSIQRTTNGDKDFLDFAATIWNRGPGPFDIEGFRHNDHARMQARQFFTTPNGKTRSVKIGRFTFDNRTGQHHWDLSDVARYTLLGDHGNWVVRSNKQSFCMEPTDPINLIEPNADWVPNEGYRLCPTAQSLWLREALQVGWGDTYFQTIGCTAFNITSLPDGVYLLRTTANPFGHIHEVTRSNDSSYLKIRLGGTTGARTVTVLGPVSKAHASIW